MLQKELILLKLPFLLRRKHIRAFYHLCADHLTLPALVDNQYRRGCLTAVEQVGEFLMRGELEKATHQVENLTQGERLASPLAREREDVARARVLLARHQPDKALTLLEPLIAGATTAGRFEYVIEMRLLQVLAHHMRHDEREALSALSLTVRLAEPEGHFRCFVDEGPSMTVLLIPISVLRNHSKMREVSHRTETLRVGFQLEERNGANGTGLLERQSPAPTTAVTPEHFLAGAPPIVEAPKAHRFHGSVKINELMMATEADKVMEEVVKHLSGLYGATVHVTLEIEAEIPDGISESTVRTVLENCAALKFKSSGFEEE